MKKIKAFSILILFCLILNGCGNNQKNYSIDDEMSDRSFSESTRVDTSKSSVVDDSIILPDYTHIDLSELSKEDLEDDFTVQGYISDYLVLNTEMPPIEQEFIDDYIADNKDYYEGEAKNMDLTLEEYSEKYFLTSDIDVYLTEAANNYYKYIIILNEIANREGITATGTDYVNYIREVTDGSVTIEEFEQNLKDNEMEETFQEVVLLDKVLTFLEEENLKNNK